MNRDPFFREIVAALAGTLDGDLFEQCVCDLLREVYPGLVVVPGGQDAGMDGAIIDLEGEPYPLVVTTSSDVRRNFRTSLDRYKEEGGVRRQVVVATSQHLTPRQLQGLRDDARKRDFTLVGHHTRTDIANLLYKSPQWCNSLLGIAGDPQPLSRVGDSTRPRLATAAIGRSDDLEWLRGVREDAVVSGVPGCGKTFVMEELAANGDGLFLASRDPTRVAEGIRSQQPTRILVDDAHVRLQDLRMLRRLRVELGKSFVIIASCWPGRVQEVARELATPQTPGTLLNLRLLTMAEIADVVRSCGVVVGDPLLQELISQSAGKPGLAVMLANLVLRSELQQIASATVALQEIGVFTDLVGIDAVEVLACFALGGEVGMKASSVASFLDIPPATIRQMLIGLAAGGILREVSTTDHTFAVEPRPLRHSLVAEVFFSGAAALPIRQLLAEAPAVGNVVSTLVGVRHRTGEVPEGLLRELLLRSTDEAAFVAYSSLGSAQVAWILDHRPGTLHRIAPVALHSHPEPIIQRLLGSSTGNHLPVNQYPGHPLRILHDWVKSGPPGSGEAVRRRRLLLTAVADYASDPKADPWVVLRALAASFDPRFESTEQSITDPLAVQLSFGTLTEDDITALSALWSRAIPILSAVRITELDPLGDLVHHWLHPGRPGPSLPSTLTDIMIDVAREMVYSVASAASEHPGIASWAARLSRQHVWNLNIAIDPEYEVLFPSKPFGPNWHEIREAACAAARNLAMEWCQRSPGDVAPRVRHLYEESRMANYRGEDWIFRVAKWIANDTGDAIAWLEALVAQDAPAEFVSPFLAASIRQAPEAVTATWQQCIESDTYRAAAVDVALSTDPLPSALLDAVLNQLDGSERVIERLSILGRLDEDRLRRLLTHSSATVRAATARGLWLGKGVEGLPSDLSAAWRRSIIATVDDYTVRDDYVLEEVFRSDPLIALEWLLHLAGNDHRLHSSPNGSLEAAINVLSITQRRRVLRGLGSTPTRAGQTRLISRLVGKDPTLYRELLQDRGLARYHLAPLVGYPGEAWQKLAEVALEAGYSPAQLAEACRLGAWGWTGKLSKMEAEWVKQFEVLEDHPDPRLREVGMLGRSLAEKQMRQHQETEHREQVFGREGGG